MDGTIAKELLVMSGLAALVVLEGVGRVSGCGFRSQHVTAFQVWGLIRVSRLGLRVSQGFSFGVSGFRFEPRFGFRV